MSTQGPDAAGIVAAIADASGESIVVIGLDGTILTWSRGASRLYGYTSDEVQGRSVSLLLPEGHRGEQEALARLGEMAAVLAHEIRNPLAGIRGAMQVMASRADPQSRDAAVTKEIIARVDTLTELMQDLLLFARPPQPRPGPVDIGPLVTTTMDLLSQDPAVKGMRVRIEGTAPVVLAYAELLKIVFQNLLINGAHAMGGSGEIRVFLASSDRACSVAFADRGPGIPADIREKIFTPFFTTKARGTGLGLPTAKRLIEAQHGTISIHRPPTGGTTVTVQLPTQ